MSDSRRFRLVLAYRIDSFSPFMNIQIRAQNQECDIPTIMYNGTVLLIVIVLCRTYM